MNYSAYRFFDSKGLETDKKSIIYIYIHTHTHTHTHFFYLHFFYTFPTLF